jgi:hypothetical protein
MRELTRLLPFTVYNHYYTLSVNIPSGTKKVTAVIMDLGEWASRSAKLLGEEPSHLVDLSLTSTLPLRLPSFKIHLC